MWHGYCYYMLRFAIAKYKSFYSEKNDKVKRGKVLMP